MNDMKLDREPLHVAGSRYWVPRRQPGEKITPLERTAKAAGDVEIVSYRKRGS